MSDNFLIDACIDSTFNLSLSSTKLKILPTFFEPRVTLNFDLNSSLIKAFLNSSEFSYSLFIILAIISMIAGFALSFNFLLSLLS